MNGHRRLGTASLAAAIGGLGTILLSLCASGHSAMGATGLRAGHTLTVFAAASLTEAFTTIGIQFGHRTGATVRFSFGGSDTLVTQIAQGAPADVFASANTAQMALAQKKGLIASNPVVFVRNKLIVIAPRNNPGHIYSLPDLARPGVRLVLAAPTVPVGKYARAAFAVMAGDAAFGPDFLARVNANVVSNELDVKAVVNKVVLGEADAGVVYVTDVTAKVAPKVASIAVSAPFNQIATYPIAVVKGSRNADLAAQFISYVVSPAGRAVLKGQGFIIDIPTATYSTSLRISGLVGHPATLTVADLQRFPAVSVTVTKRTEKKALGSSTYTGALLNDVVQAAHPISNTSFKNDMLRQFVTVVGTDNYQVTVAVAEILPAFGHERVLLAYAKDGKPLPRAEGAIELIVPGDMLAGRDVTNVDGIVVGTPVGTP